MHQLASKLAPEKFESWFQRQAGNRTIVWESNHCGEAAPTTGNRDLPICAQAAATFADGATATVMIGVGSAVLALLNQVRILRQAGRAISIACIDAPAAESTKDKNRIWAANILRAKLAHPNAAVVALLSRTPARVQTGLPGNPDYVPGGRYLKQKVPDLVSLSMSFASGSAWSCQQDGCAVHPLEGDEWGDRACVHVGSPVADEESASGTLFFATIAPSEPAKTLLQAKSERPISH